MKYFGLCLVALLCMGVAVPAAHADLLYTNLPSGINACCFSVNLHDLGTGVEVTVTLQGGATLFAATGNTQNHPGFAFNLSSSITSANITNVSHLGTFHVGPDATNGPSFGTFGYYFDNLGPGTSANNAGPLVFDVTGVSIADFVKNGAGYYFASDIYNPNRDGSKTAESAINTPGTPTSTPEPASLLLLGSGLLGLAARRRK